MARGGGRRGANRPEPGCPDAAQLAIEQLVLAIEELALAVEFEDLLMERLFLLFQGGDFFLNGGAQLIEIIGGGWIGNRAARHRDQRDSAKQQRRRHHPQAVR